MSKSFKAAAVLSALTLGGGYIAFTNGAFAHLLAGDPPRMFSSSKRMQIGIPAFHTAEVGETAASWQPRQAETPSYPSSTMAGEPLLSIEQVLVRNPSALLSGSKSLRIELITGPTSKFSPSEHLLLHVPNARRNPDPPRSLPWPATAGFDFNITRAPLPSIKLGTEKIVLPPEWGGPRP